jgi:hypothetical protein
MTIMAILIPVAKVQDAQRHIAQIIHANVKSSNGSANGRSMARKIKNPLCSWCVKAIENNYVVIFDAEYYRHLFHKSCVKPYRNFLTEYRSGGK